MAILALVAAMALVDIMVSDPRPAQAAEPLDCSAVYTLQGNSPRALWKVDQATGNQTEAARFTTPENTGGAINGLGIDDFNGDGRGDTAIAALAGSGANAAVRYIYQLNPVTGTTELLGQGVNNAALTFGDINPVNHIFYYGGVANGELSVYGFNPSTKTSLGLVARGPIPTGNNGSNGDFVFDSQGNLYAVAGVNGQNKVSVINQQLPSTGGTTMAITATELSTVTTPASKPINGLAFSGDGYLQLTATDIMFKANPTTGAVVEEKNLSNSGSVDASSCASPNTLEVRKNFSDGRVSNSDQVQMRVTGGGITGSNTVTTQGTKRGIQDQKIGPLLVLANNDFTLSETGSGADPRNYDSSWSCVDQNDGNRSIGQGTGTGGTFRIPGSTPGGKPKAVVCTLTNKAKLPSLSVQKSADKTDLVAGETVTYAFDVTNTGNQTLSDVAVAEGDFTGSGEMSDISCPSAAASLAPGAKVTCTATYVVTQADVDRGSVKNTATSTGTSPDGVTVTSPSAEVTITGRSAPALSVTKTADKQSLVAGETVTYSFQVRNTGNQTISDVEIVEDEFTGSGELSDVSCPSEASSLAPNAAVTCTATYVVTQADVDRGSVENSARASGTTPSGGDVSSTLSTVTLTSDDNPALSLSKSADKFSLIAGETVTYSFAVTNSGNRTVSAVRITEVEFSGSGDLSEITCPAGVSSLAPGESVTCTASYVVTQADVDRGTITNSATAGGQSPTGSAVTSNESGLTIEGQSAPALSLEKTADTDSLVAGETVTYSFAVTNTGNQTVSGVSIVEGEFTGSGELSEVTCPDEAGSLAPGDSVTCTATYEVTQADVDQGSVKNVASAKGTSPSNDDVESDDSEVTISGESSPGVSLTKSADTDTLVAGETVTYSFEATNTGNVTLSGVTIAEGAFTGSGAVSAVSCPDEAGSVAPGDSVTCTATYEVTQADVDQGSVRNVATASGTSPTGDAVTSDLSEVTITGEAAPALSVEKSADKDSLVAGETVTYSFEVTNSGNQTVSAVSIAEGEFTGSGDLAEVTCPDEAGSLAPGDSVTCTATYEVTQADVDRGSLENSATATGTSPAGDDVTSEPSAVTITGENGAALSVEKTADKDSLVAGETVTYSFEVTNTGNQTITEVDVVEGEFTGSGDLAEVTCPDEAGSLAPGDSVTCTATYEVTQADVDRGSLENSATAAGKSPAGDDVNSEPSEVTITGENGAALSLEKTADKDSLIAGETVTYSFEVTNTGNRTVSGVSIAEGEFTGSGDLAEVTCPDEAGSLAPGDSVTCTATYEVTQADADRGSLENSATATGKNPAGDDVASEPSEVTITDDTAATLSVTKSADKSSLVAGETVTYTFTVTNTSNRTISDVSVVEGEFTGSGDLSDVSCPGDSTTLAPGASVTCTAMYDVTQADVDRGSLENSATATGKNPAGDDVTSEPSAVTITGDGAPALALTKTADAQELVAGETVTYSFAVTNTGNQTVSGVSIAEGEFTGSGDLSEVTCPDDASSLAPGDSVTCTATYEVTQADVDQGSVTNSATATGTSPAGEGVTSEPSEVTVTNDPNPALSMTKTADTDSLVAGETVTYSFEVTNTGNQTVSGVSIAEGEFTGSGDLAEVTCPDEAGSLAPGDSVTCTATYEVTQADVDRGSLENSATATGTSPAGDGVTSEPSGVTIIGSAAATLALNKSADKDSLVAGETVTYSFEVTNTGNQTITELDVVESEFTGSGDLSEVTCPDEAGSLAPGDSVTCTATYEVTQADVDRGELTNSATATGTSPAGDDVTSAPSRVTIVVDDTGDEATAADDTTADDNATADDDSAANDDSTPDDNSTADADTTADDESSANDSADADVNRNASASAAASASADDDANPAAESAAQAAADEDANSTASAAATENAEAAAQSAATEDASSEASADATTEANAAAAGAATAAANADDTDAANAEASAGAESNSGAAAQSAASEDASSEASSDAAEDADSAAGGGASNNSAAASSDADPAASSGANSTSAASSDAGSSANSSSNSDGGPLPRTGAAGLAVLGGLALLLIAGGVTALVVSRRRRSED